MAQLITAPVGTGKTLKCIELCFKYLNQGREVYTNIIGIKVSGVRVIESNNLHPFDWRDLPNGAVLIFDEAHEHPAFSERDLLRNHKIQFWEDELKRINTLDLPSTKRKELLTQTKEMYSKILKDEKEKILDIGISMSMHRHFDIELILVTQNPTKLNRDVLGNITIHKVMRRKFGFEAANIWTFGEAMTTWGKTVADGALVKEYWKFPKHLFNFYNSAESHNVEKYFPKKYYAFACIPLFIFYLGYSKASETGFFGLIPKAESAEVVQEDSSLETLPSAEVVELDDNDPTKLALDQENADMLGITLEQYRALKSGDVEKAISLPPKSYNSSDPFDYSYMQAPPVTAHQVFSGCFNNVPYDTQGTIIHGAPKDLCSRLYKGDRPFNPYKQVNTNYGMAVQNNPTQDYQSAPKQDIPQVQSVQNVQMTADDIERLYGKS
ncbi:zonular occludens toxin domain-containing protein [Acinetobacter schindleri]|uniref:zonular occludens toxin domain-containing protein n=1 Tax=Acinetobacter schindleri TaxID=108981 RepID=UPI0009728C46|nr:zonular occludens toxin domain-containing protein [Acinetobacter schindleri]APX62751.1 zonula occludens toxin protein [Acinetobacter schindleri]